MATAQVPQSSSAHAAQQRPPLWRDAGVLKWFAQIVALVLVVGTLWFLSTEAVDNLEAGGISPGTEWLNGPANIQLSEGIDTVPNSAGRALWSGMVTNLRLAVIGIILSTILGLAVGLARLSNNWLANKAASIFIETLRNIPVLVQILLWLTILTSIGALTPDRGPISGWLIISQKGVSGPRIFLADGFYQWAVLMGLAGVVTYFVRKSLNAKRDREGGTSQAGKATVAIMGVSAVVFWFINPIVGFLGTPLQAISDGWGGIPQPVMQAILSALAAGAAVNWIRRFLNSRRTPAGLAKLTDDDYFRMIFAGIAALLAVIVLWRWWPGLSSWIINSGSDFWQVAADKFGDGRGARPLDGMKPTVSEGRFANYGPTGWTLTVFAAALLFGLVFYTASFIAEIIRGGILAVAKGQTEAAAALGLSRSQALRKVILPQAFRIVMPPLGNQYLNITKNTSLAIAVGLSDVVQVGQSLANKNNQFLTVFAIWMLFYLACSLTISLIVNTINARLAIVER